MKLIDELKGGEVKVMLVKRPSDGHTYVIFTRATVMDDFVGILVSAVVRPIMTGGKVPFPLEIHGKELEDIVEECMPQIQAFATELDARVPKK